MRRLKLRRRLRGENLPEAPGVSDPLYIIASLSLNFSFTFLFLSLSRHWSWLQSLWVASVSSLSHCFHCSPYLLGDSRRYAYDLVVLVAPTCLHVVNDFRTPLKMSKTNQRHQSCLSKCRLPSLPLRSSASSSSMASRPRPWSRSATRSLLLSP